jgi:glycosyltransferase involved in cell wall biosynthesis
MEKLSIITINLNNDKGLRKTIESILIQTYSEYEYIIIDGGSTDGSVEVIKENEHKISFWVSEPDTGIYNAMNKGILKATGEYFLFLNSGDWLVDNNVLTDFSDLNSKEDIVCGNLLLWYNGESILRESLQKEDLSFEFFYRDTLPHPASFIKSELFKIFGLYNEKNVIVSDWEFFFKCLILNNCTYNHFDRIISYFDLTGISSKEETRIIQKKERDMIFRAYLPLVYKSYRKICDERDYFLSHESDYQEYMNLKNGKFSLFIKLFLFIKRTMKKT